MLAWTFTSKQSSLLPSLTETQFDRCLDQLFGIVLTPQDDAKLMEKYGSSEPKHRGMVSYRKFCEVIGAGKE